MPPHPSHPLFAAVYDPLTRPAERGRLLALRRELLAGCSGDLLDVGAGTGGNFAVLREMLDAGAPLRVTAAEPDPHMARRARRRAERLGLQVRLVEAPAEALPFGDASFDVVVSALLLCTVADLAGSLNEMRRVLRQGGELRFMEHVRAGGASGRWQDRLRRPWALAAGGCQLNRETGAALRRAGFGSVTWRSLPMPFPVCTLLVGQAQR